MTLDTAQFRHEYDLSSLERIRPSGHEFEMFVTPRYRHHYLDQSYEAFTATLVRSSELLKGATRNTLGRLNLPR